MLGLARVEASLPRDESSAIRIKWRRGSNQTGRALKAEKSRPGLLSTRISYEIQLDRSHRSKPSFAQSTLTLVDALSRTKRVRRAIIQLWVVLLKATITTQLATLAKAFSQTRNNNSSNRLFKIRNCNESSKMSRWLSYLSKTRRQNKYE